MKALRAKPAARAKLTRDAFGRRREQLRAQKTTAYLARVEAANQAEDAAAAAAVAAREAAHATVGDVGRDASDAPESDDGSEEPPTRSTKKGGKRKRGGV